MFLFMFFHSYLTLLCFLLLFCLLLLLFILCMFDVLCVCFIVVLYSYVCICVALFRFVLLVVVFVYCLLLFFEFSLYAFFMTKRCHLFIIFRWLSYLNSWWQVFAQPLYGRCRNGNGRCRMDRGFSETHGQPRSVWLA